jgi:DNA modification methylase
MIVHCAHDALVSIKELKPNPLNRNSHPKNQIERLAKVLEYQGWRYPIKVSKRSGLITSGHGRLEAAKLLKWKEVPVSFQEYASEEQEYADTISDNSIASWSELDLSGINSDLTDLGPDFDIDLLGIKDFVLEPIEKLEPQCDEDEVPDALPEPKVVKGEVYILGNHRLMCGDSTAITDVERLMDGKKADFVYMDPPYGMNLKTDYAMTNRVEGKTYRPVIGDDEDFDPRFFFEYFKDAREHFWWGADYYCNYIPKGGAWVVWDKKKDDLDESIGTGFELCWSKKPHKRMLARFLWSGFTAKERKETRVHPTQKPIALHEWFFERWGKPADSVVDLFGGSGSTLIACEKTDRHCFMMELDPHYCGVILDRWQKYTGKKAHREDGVAWDEIKAGVADGAA